MCRDGSGPTTTVTLSTFFVIIYLLSYFYLGSKTAPLIFYQKMSEVNMNSKRPVQLLILVNQINLIQDFSEWFVIGKKIFVLGRRFRGK